MAEMIVDDEEVSQYQNEEFSFVFVAMGQGDCMMARCPNGKVVLVDCGSTAYLDWDRTWFSGDARQLLRTVDWAGGMNNEIEVCILTHPDRDHYNKVRHLTQASGSYLNNDLQAKITIGELYYGGIRTRYGADALFANIKAENVSVAFLNRVEIRANRGRITQWEPEFGYEEINLHAVQNNRYTVLSGTTDDGKEWSVSLLAGNVPRLPHQDNDSWVVNSSSVVTLFEIDGTKLLSVGDATTDTEDFLRAHHQNLLTNIDTVQVGHHGSSDTSSSQNWVNLVNPNRAIVSVGFMEHSYILPRYLSLNRWITRLSHHTRVDDHSFDYWLAPNEAPATNNAATRPVNYSNPNDILNFWRETWPNDIQDNATPSKRATFWNLQNIPQGVDANGQAYEPIWAFTSGGYLLKRISTDTNIQVTSQGTIAFQIP